MQSREPKASTGSQSTKINPSLIAGLKRSRSFSARNIVKLALVSIFLTAIDTVQSYYGQRVVNVFSEANALPFRFYSYGFVGYLAYAPIEFLITFSTLMGLWAWASYVIWYSRNFTISLSPLRLKARSK